MMGEQLSRNAAWDGWNAVAGGTPAIQFRTAGVPPAPRTEIILDNV